jgi:hypothetical protein
MTQHKPGLPIFLENSPSMACEQVLWLIKNSNLNFQLKETPFSLGVNIKKSFVNPWNCPSSPINSNVNPVPHQTFASSAPLRSFQEPPLQQTLDPFKFHHNSELLKQVECLKASYDEAVKDNDDTLKNFDALDKAHKKLVKENKELQNKHEKICLEMKKLKNDNEMAVKQNNTLSVAFKSSKKDSENNLKKFDKEINAHKIELEKLIEFKTQTHAEVRKAKKAEKKIKQKEKRITLKN